MIATLVDDARSRFALVWKELLLTSLFYKAVAFAVLTPAAALLVSLVVATSGSSAVADEDILSFFLTPLGIVGLIAMAGVTLALVALQQACLMAVALGASYERRVAPRDVLAHVLRQWRSVLELTARIVVGALARAAPFLAVGGGVYLWRLTEHDINFYLAQRPPEFVGAVAMIAGVLTVMVPVLLYHAVGWLLSVPTLLFEHVSPREALALAAQRVEGRRLLMLKLLAAWAVAAVVLSSGSTALVAWIARLLTPWVVGNMALISVVLATTLFLMFFTSQAATFINGSTFALLVTGVYRETQAGQQVDWRREMDTMKESAQWQVSRSMVAAVLAVGVLGGLAFAGWAIRGLAADSDAVITAHRGASMFAPENTLASVQRALDDGTDWVEIDVQESADGRVMVVHDSDFMKLAGVPTKVWEATYADTRDIDIGSSFAPEFSDQRTPTLEEVLELARGRAGVNIELKYYGHNDQLEERVIDIVEALGVQDDIVVMSLKYDMVQKMRSLRPDWRLGLLTAVVIGDLTRLDADFLAVNTGIATRAFVQHAHGEGKDVYVWTVNDPVTVFALLVRGADGIITDDPAMARQVLRQFNDMSGVERFLAEVGLLLGVFQLDDDAPEEVG